HGITRFAYSSGRNRLSPEQPKAFGVLARFNFVGRSLADFMLPGRNKEWVLAVASGVASELGMKVEMTSMIQLKARRGSIWWTGTRNFVVTDQIVLGGASVHIEAWVGGLAALSGDQSGIIRLIPRRGSGRCVSRIMSA